MERMYRTFRVSAWLGKPRMRFCDLVAEAIRLYRDELEGDENAGAESVVVKHYTIAV